MVVRIAPAYGPFQDPRQPIALMISRALQGKSVPVPKRDRTAHAFTFVEDVSDAIARVLWKGEPGRIYDIAASEGATFTAAAGLILRLTGRSERLIVRESNPAWYSRAHEFLDTRPLRQLGWEPRHSLVDGLQKTIEWFRANEDWWQKAGRTQA
jgi:dTDP-glucose 4,6-dehydratase